MDKKPISDLCDQHGIQPSQFYRWQQEFFERGSLIFESRGEKPSTALERKVTALEEKLTRKNERAGRVDGGARGVKKKSWGELKLKWVPHDLRDQVVDFVRRWSEKTEIPAARLVGWAGLARSKFFDWKSRYGKANEHNGWIPRDHWLEEWEETAIIDFHQKNPLEGYRRLTFMMLDADIVAVSPASVYRVLAGAGLLGVRNWSPSKKGTGFVQPLQAARALARGRLLPQHLRHLLLPVQRPGRLQPL